MSTLYKSGYGISETEAIEILSQGDSSSGDPVGGQGYLFVDSAQIPDSRFLALVRSDRSLDKNVWSTNRVVARNAKVTGHDSIVLGLPFSISVNSSSGGATRNFITKRQSLPLPPGFVYMSSPTSTTDVTTRGVHGNNTDVTGALRALATDTTVKDWYFPDGDYKLQTIVIPAHVRTITGSGNARIENISSDWRGVIHIDSNYSNRSNILVEGLRFVRSNRGNSSTWSSGYLTMDGQDIQNMHVRNCEFTNNNSAIKTDGMNITGSNRVPSANGVYNIYLYNNKYHKFASGAGLEVGYGYGGIDPLNVGAGMNDIYIFNSEFINCGWCGVSLSQQQRGTFIFNNKFITDNAHASSTKSWAVEFNQTNGASFFNNDIECSKSVIIASFEGYGWHSPARIDDNITGNFNLFFRNKVTAPTSYLAILSTTIAMMDNYIEAKLLSTEGEFGSINGNTFISDKNKPVALYGLGDFVYKGKHDYDYGTYVAKRGNLSEIKNRGIFRDNTIYALNGANQNIGTSDSTQTIANNTILTTPPPPVPERIGALHPEKIGIGKFYA